MATLNGSLFCFSETLLNLWKQNTKQMKSTQLRIGNWYSEYGIPKQATPEIISNLYAIEQNGKTAIDFDFLPLTEEWLLKAGFEIRESLSYKEYFIGTNEITHDWLFSLTWLKNPERIDAINAPFYNNGRHTVQYVHQLQNLYFALTGKELEFKL